MVYVLDITSLFFRPWIHRNITSKRALDHLNPPSSWLHQRLGNIGQVTICQTIHPYAIRGILFVAYSQGLGSMDCRCMVWRIVDNSFIHANDTSMILLWHFFVNKKEKYHWGNVQEVKWLGADGDSRMRLWYFFVQKMFRVNGIKGVSTDAFWKNRDTSCLLVLWLPIDKNQDKPQVLWYNNNKSLWCNMGSHKTYDNMML